MTDQLKTKQLKNRKQRGQSLVEMARMLPVLLVLIISGLEVGRLFYAKIVVTNAAREGAYYVSLYPTDFANGTLAVQAEANNSGIGDVTVSYTTKDIGGYTSIEVTVETQVQDLLIVGFLGNVFSITTTHHSVFPVSSTVEMMIQ